MSETTSLVQEGPGRDRGVLCEEHVLKCQVSVLCVPRPNTQHRLSLGVDMNTHSLTDTLDTVHTNKTWRAHPGLWVHTCKLLLLLCPSEHTLTGSTEPLLSTYRHARSSTHWQLHTGSTLCKCQPTWRSLEAEEREEEEKQQNDRWPPADCLNLC